MDCSVMACPCLRHSHSVSVEKWPAETSVQGTGNMCKTMRNSGGKRKVSVHFRLTCTGRRYKKYQRLQLVLNSCSGYESHPQTTHCHGQVFQNYNQELKLIFSENFRDPIILV